MIFNLLKAFSNKILLLSFLIYHGVGISNIIIIYILYCTYKYYTEETNFIYQNTERNLKIVQSSKILKNPNFKPYFLLSNHFLQMIFQKSIHVKSNDLKFTKEKVKNSGAILEWIEMGDKEQLSNSSIICQDKILFIIPGLTGGKHDNYICNISYEGIKNNYIVVVYQNVMLTEELFHPEQGSQKKFDFFEDLDNALNHVQTRYPNKKIYAVGYSYGANKLVKYLGSKNVLNKRIYCAVSVANPFDMIVCQRTLSELMDKLLLSFLKKVVNRQYAKYVHLDKHFEFNLHQAMKSKTLIEFDRCVVTRILGFKTVDDYYRGISCIHDIRKVDIPLLCLNSLDDVISNPKCIPFDEVKLNENIFLLVTNSGSHLGWISNQSFFKLKQWMHEPILDFFSSFDKCSLEL